MVGKHSASKDAERDNKTTLENLFLLFLSNTFQKREACLMSQPI